MIETRMRRHDWTEGYWMTLGDGQRWCLPFLEFKPDLAIRSTGAALPTWCPSMPEIFGFMNLMKEAKTEGIRAFVIRATIARLLRANYTLDDDQAKDLLPFGIDGIDPGFDNGLVGEAIKAIRAVILDPAQRVAVLGITPPGIN